VGQSGNAIQVSGNDMRTLRECGVHECDHAARHEFADGTWLRKERQGLQVKNDGETTVVICPRCETETGYPFKLSMACVMLNKCPSCGEPFDENRGD